MHLTRAGYGSPKGGDNVTKKFTRRAAATLTAAAILVPIVVGAQAAAPNTIDFGLDTIGPELGLSQNQDIKGVIASIVRVLLGFLGIIAVLIVLYGGFQWMTAAGNEDRVSSARATLTAGLIGLVIILSAYALASFIITTILDATA